MSGEEESNDNQRRRRAGFSEREKEEMQMTRAAFTELVRYYLDAIGIPIATIENEIVTRSERVLNQS
jgi:hypothetical protein